MSTLQKVEEAYLGILRFIIIVSSSLLLIAALVFGFLGLSNSHEKAIEAESVGGVKSEEVIGKVAENAEKTKPANPATTPGRRSGDALEAKDPNHSYYARTADAIIGFAEKYAPRYFDLSKEKIISIIKSKAEHYQQDDKLVSAYASGLADTMEKALLNPAIVKRVEKPKADKKSADKPNQESVPDSEVDQPPADEAPFKESPLDIVDEVIQVYDQVFQKNEADKERERARRLAEEMERKATAATQFYFAGGAFLAFLFLVFISIVVKIERNIRVIAEHRH